MCCSCLTRSATWIENHLQFTVTIGLGDEAEDIITVSESYKEAIEALNYKMVEGVNRIILFHQLSTQSGNDLYPYLHTIRTIVHAFSDAGRLENTIKSFIPHNTE